MRIASLAPSNTEILYSLDAEDQIVASTSLYEHPETYDEITAGGWINPDIEKVKDVDPDLVLASDTLQDEVVRSLRNEGLKVKQLNPENLDEVYESIHILGDLVGAESKASKTVSEMKNEISSVNLEGKRIYCEEWINPPMVSGNWIPDLVREANGEYFIDGGRSREFQTEKLKNFNPEYIFLNICGASENVDKELVYSRDGWSSISALENNRVHVIDDKLLNRPSSSIVNGVKKMERVIK